MVSPSLEDMSPFIPDEDMTNLLSKLEEMAGV